LSIFTRERDQEEEGGGKDSAGGQSLRRKVINHRKYFPIHTDLQLEIEELTKNQRRYQNKVAHFRKYEEYLEKVRNLYSDQYPEMQDILNRYQTLKKSNKDLIESRQKLESDH
jgi:FtsZ-binding cell division protein ZapB